MGKDKHVKVIAWDDRDDILCPLCFELREPEALAENDLAEIVPVYCADCEERIL